MFFISLTPIFDAISGDPAAAGLDNTNTAYSNCEIMNSPGGSDAEEKQSFLQSLAMLFLKSFLEYFLCLL